MLIFATLLIIFRKFCGLRLVFYIMFILLYILYHGFIVLMVRGLFRSQRVVLDNCVSNDVEVLSGVPQGSILGPLLFVLFINDIYDNINENSRISLYADDTKLWRRINSALDCDILQKDIDTLYKWTMTNSSSSTKRIAMKTSKIKIYPLHKKCNVDAALYLPLHGFLLS